MHVEPFHHKRDSHEDQKRQGENFDRRMLINEIPDGLRRNQHDDHGEDNGDGYHRLHHLLEHRFDHCFDRGFDHLFDRRPGRPARQP